jgi:hypothetical protein
MAWLCVAYVLLSALEYVGHRWVMHNAWLSRRYARARHEFESHHVLHHFRFYGRGRFERCGDPAARHISIDLQPGFMLIASSWIWGPLMAFSMTGSLTIAAAFVLHGIVWSAIHREMHEPRGAWFARTRLYHFWLRYHRQHHEDTRRHFNVVCPLFDQFFGT